MTGAHDMSVLPAILTLPKPSFAVPTIAIATLRYVAAFVIALSLFSLILILDGVDAGSTLRLMYDASLGSEFGRNEILVKLIPFGLCAAAVAIPARAGLINVGGEGQFYMGAFFASGVILYSGAPGWALLPLGFVAGAVGGGAWAGVVGAAARQRQGQRGD